MRQLVVFSSMCMCPPCVLHKALSLFFYLFKSTTKKKREKAPQFKIYFDFMNILINFFLVSARDQRGSRPHLIRQEIISIWLLKITAQMTQIESPPCYFKQRINWYLVAAPPVMVTKWKFSILGKRIGTEKSKYASTPRVVYQLNHDGIVQFIHPECNVEPSLCFILSDSVSFVSSFHPSNNLRHLLFHLMTTITEHGD